MFLRSKVSFVDRAQRPLSKEAMQDSYQNVMALGRTPLLPNYPAVAKDTQESQRQRAKFWSKEEIGLFVDLWISPEVQNELQNTYHNEVVFNWLSNEMGLRGFNRSARQCREKMNALKKKFKEVTTHNKCPGAGEVRTMPFYDKLATILLSRRDAKHSSNSGDKGQWSRQASSPAPGTSGQASLLARPSLISPPGLRSSGAASQSKSHLQQPPQKQPRLLQAGTVSPTHCHRPLLQPNRSLTMQKHRGHSSPWPTANQLAVVTPKIEEQSPEGEDPPNSMCSVLQGSHLPMEVRVIDENGITVTSSMCEEVKQEQDEEDAAHDPELQFDAKFEREIVDDSDPPEATGTRLDPDVLSEYSEEPYDETEGVDDLPVDLLQCFGDRFSSFGGVEESNHEPERPKHEHPLSRALSTAESLIQEQEGEVLENSDIICAPLGNLGRKDLNASFEGVVGPPVDRVPPARGLGDDAPLTSAQRTARFRNKRKIERVQLAKELINATRETGENIREALYELDSKESQRRVDDRKVAVWCAKHIAKSIRVSSQTMAAAMRDSDAAFQRCMESYTVALERQTTLLENIADSLNARISAPQPSLPTSTPADRTRETSVCASPVPAPSPSIPMESEKTPPSLRSQPGNEEESPGGADSNSSSR
ncbi:uncharacterized protein [Pituophis catenifer annectens]|uniref:uncharacterized protein n=1 Tax=Pituophis catenifer annectens TaxID=94852 RepID=UPI0039964B82